MDFLDKPEHIVLRDTIIATLEEFFNAGSWENARSILELHQEILLTDDAEKILLGRFSL